MTSETDTVSVQRLFEAGAHFAQVKSRRHPSMKAFIVGTKGRVEIIDLAKSAAQLDEARRAMETLARDGKTVLVVGGKPEIASIVKDAAEKMGQAYVSTRWLGGTISNFTEIKKRIDRLAALKSERESGALAKRHTKLELVFLAREEERLSNRLDGISELQKRPDALVVVDTKHERHAVKEARDAGIPIVGIMSSDCTISDAAYPIVLNDASRETVRLALSELAGAFTRGRAS